MKLEYGGRALWYKIEDIACRGGGENVATLRRWRDEARDLLDYAAELEKELRAVQSELRRFAMEEEACEY